MNALKNNAEPPLAKYIPKIPSNSKFFIWHLPNTCAGLISVTQPVRNVVGVRALATICSI